MGATKVEAIWEFYMQRADVEDYDVNATLDILIECVHILKYHTMVGTEADTLTFSEFTRRYENAVKELLKLLKSDKDGERWLV